MDFNPSSSNFAEIILMEDDYQQSYRLKIGGSSADQISLVYQMGASESTLITSPPQLLSASAIKLNWRVQRYADSIWVLDYNLDSTQWHTAGTAPDTLVFASKYFGLLCHYTKTRANKFFFDDISVNGTPFQDTVAPWILSSIFTDRKTIALTLSEGTSADTATIVDQNGGCWDWVYTGVESAELRSASTCADGSYTFIPNGISDDFGNALPSFSVSLQRPNKRDVLITEIMDNPTPAVEWESEYFELLNTTGDTLKLQNWTLEIGSSSYPLQMQLHPNERVVISNEEMPISSANYVVNRSSLLPTNSVIRIIDDWGETVELLEYSHAFHSSTWKSKGGWAMVRNETAPPCTNVSAWSSSNNPTGGSPGLPNTPEPTIYSSLNDIRFIEWKSDSLHIHFNLSIAEWNSEPADNVADFTSSIVRIYAAEAAQLNLNYTLCNGTSSDSTFILYSIPNQEPHDILITEVLFDPESNTPEFIEMVNRSNDCFLLGDIRISNWNEEYGIEELHPIGKRHQLWMPGEVIVLTDADATALFAAYPHHNTRSLGSTTLPISLPKEGGACLTTANGTVLDAVIWSEDSYPSNLSDTKGYSLVRVGEASKWTVNSSAQRATPGIDRKVRANPSDGVRLQNTVISPNGDGYQDEITIATPKSWAGSRIDFNIRTADGLLVTQVLEQHALSESELLNWDGKANGSSLPPGQYLLELSATFEDGKISHWRHGCLLKSN